jgi:hypothetical protein
MYKFRIDRWLIRANRNKETNTIDFFGFQNFRYFSGAFYFKTFKFSYNNYNVTERQKQVLEYKITKLFKL